MTWLLNIYIIWSRLLKRAFNAEILRKLIDEHKETYDSENLRDFIDTFLLEMEKGKDSTFTVSQKFTYFLLLLVLWFIFDSGKPT